MISRTTLDQLTEILRSELDRKARSRAGAPGAASTNSAAPKAAQRSVGETLRSHVHQLVAAGVTDEFQLTHAAVQHVLRRQLGNDLVNDPSFQAVARRVTQTVLEDDQFRNELLSTFLASK